MLVLRMSDECLSWNGLVREFSVILAMQSSRKKNLFSQFSLISCRKCYSKPIKAKVLPHIPQRLNMSIGKAFRTR